MYDNLTSHQEEQLKCITIELLVVLGLFNDGIYNEDDYIHLSGHLISLQGKIVQGQCITHLDEQTITRVLTAHSK